MWKTAAYLLIASTLTALFGCASGKCGSCSSSAAPNLPGHDPWDGQTQAREIVSIGHVDLLGFRGPDHEEASSAGDPREYRLLDAETCKCQAAAGSLFGNLLDSQSRALHQDWSTSRCGQSGATDLEGNLLAHKAVHARNEAAADALELYYLLAEAEANQEFLDQSLTEVTTALGNLKDAEEVGFAVEEDYVNLLRRRNELVSQQAALKPAIHELNGKLYRLLGVDWEGSTMIWPSIDLNVDTQSVDIAAALGTAMDLRADLIVFDVALGRLTEANLPAISQLMRGENVSFSPPAVRPRGFLAGNDRTHRLRSTKSQLGILRTAKHREVHNEIQSAAIRLRAASLQLALAREMLATWNRTIVDLQDKRDAANATTFEMFAATMERIDAERKVMHEITAYRIAEMKFKQAQGLLAFECGYGMPRCGCATQALSARQ